MKNKLHCSIAAAIAVLFFTVIIGHSAQSQVNLVPNPSFEIISQCPYQANQVYLAQGWDSYGWSPDYYNACFNINWPNVGGFQSARTGDGYVGSIFFDYNSNSRQEFYGIKLSDTLEIGTTYYVSFYLNCGGGNNSHIACNKQGVLFSTIKYDSVNVPSINNFAHLVNDSIITDTINWYKVSSSFVADSNYLYLIIGSFFQSSITDTIHFRNLSVNFPYAYYFVDDVCVSEDSLMCSVTEGLNALENKNRFTIFPNPSQGDFEVRANYYKEIENIQLFDLLGRKQSLNTYSNGATTYVSIQNSIPGSYFLCFDSEGEFYSIKILFIN